MENWLMRQNEGGALDERQTPEMGKLYAEWVVMSRYRMGRLREFRSRHRDRKYAVIHKMPVRLWIKQRKY
jgi:hypothetical protein